MGAATGVCKGTLDRRRWDAGVLVPWIEYAEAPVRAPPQPASQVLKLGDAGPEVRDLQERLRAAHFSPGVIDGIFGPHTQGAVVAFQVEQGLVADGEVGPSTSAALAAL
jgi:peptidoglycan hydrolase-like protein with peptidoglycan-binding domain